MVRHEVALHVALALVEVDLEVHLAEETCLEVEVALEPAALVNNKS